MTTFRTTHPRTGHRSSLVLGALVLAAGLGTSVSAAADDVDAAEAPELPPSTEPTVDPASSTASAPAAPDPPGTFRFDGVDGFVRLGAYVEVYGQWNPRSPWNGIDAYRAFDSRADTFSLTNACLSIDFDLDHVIGRIALQVGLGPSTYYASEPTHPAWGGVGASGPEVWKYLQEAYAGYEVPGAHGPTIEAGIFLSPVGPESMSARDNAHFSHSNLFFGLPFYHTGVRVTVPVVRDTKVALYVINGWNSVVDSNRAKSLIAQLQGVRGALSGSVLYLGGVERVSGDPAGTPWRHMVDASGSFHRPGSRLTLVGELNGGLEHNAFGRSSWGATALSVRVDLHPQVYVALRGDFFYEHRASSSAGQASAIFWPSPYVSEGTFTLAYEPNRHLSIRFEYRHDEAQGPTYFDQARVLDANGNAVPTVRAQDTLTLAFLAGF